MVAETKKILQKAVREKYAVGHFNVNNMETVQGVVNAGVRLKSPLILATSEGAIAYAGLNFLRDLVATASELADIPIALHLDHGRDLKLIRQCIQAGYSSVMIDGSHLMFEGNVAITKKVVSSAHGRGLSVEAELGTIGGAEDTVSAKKIIYTDPLKAREFVDRTGCDFLAVAVGTSHGAYKFKERASLRIDLLKEIRKAAKVPLVLHGASGVPRDIVTLAERYGADLSGVRGVPDIEIRKAIRQGIAKINTDTDLRLAFDASVRRFLSQKPKDFDPRHILAPAREMIQNVAEHRIRLFGSVRKA